MEEEHVAPGPGRGQRHEMRGSRRHRVRRFLEPELPGKEPQLRPLARGLRGEGESRETE